MYVLRFLSGPRRGEQVDLPQEGELTLGRTAEAEVVIPEDMVSRRHARLHITAGALELSDLSSTNGTFVNGQKITTQKVALDDRILVGSSVMQLADANSPVEVSGIHIVALPPRKEEATAAIRGRLEQVPVTEVLQLLARGKKTGTLTIGPPKPATLAFHNGDIVGIEVTGHPRWTPQKALCRLVQAKTGTFDFAPASAQDKAPAGPPALAGSLEAQLLEAARQGDEALAKRAAWPDGQGALSLRLPLVPRLKDLNHRELEILQAAINAASVDELLDAEPGPDAPILTTLSELHNAGYLWPRPAGTPTPFGP